MEIANDCSGFESGPIRLPSEAGTLILRVTGNCSWNRCKFCGLYKGEKFRIRPVEDVIKDIDCVKHFVDLIAANMSKPDGGGIQQVLEKIPAHHKGSMMAFQMVWVAIATSRAKTAN